MALASKMLLVVLDEFLAGKAGIIVARLGMCYLRLLNSFVLGWPCVVLALPKYLRGEAGAA